MDIRKEIIYRAGKGTRQNYINEATFAFGKIFFKNSKRIINIADTIKNKAKKL
jgi:hypothetical protein